MLKICLAFWKYEPQYAYKCDAYKKNVIDTILESIWCVLLAEILFTAKKKSFDH